MSTPLAHKPVVMPMADSPLEDRSKRASPAYVFSLGTHCYAAERLKAVGLRLFTGPFDWLFSDPGMVAECLEDRFANFLDWRQMEGRGHAAYSTRYHRPIIFAHHDLTLVKDQANFERAARRMLKALDGEAPCLLFCVTPKGRGRDASIDRLASALSRFRAPIRLLLIVLHPHGAHPDGRVLSSRVTGGGVPYLNLHPISPLVGGLVHEDPNDDEVVHRLLGMERIVPLGDPLKGRIEISPDQIFRP